MKKSIEKMLVKLFNSKMHYIINFMTSNKSFKTNNIISRYLIYMKKIEIIEDITLKF